MNKFFFSYMLLCSFVAMTAQKPHNSIFEALERPPNLGKGGVVIHQSESIKRLVGTRMDSVNVDIMNGKKHLKTMGYRIHIYSGNNQRSSPGSNQPISKVETETLKTKIIDLYPNVEAYTRFDAPWWSLYVGDYITLEEASVMKRELQKVFPQRKNEIYIVENEIRLPMD